MLLSAPQLLTDRHQLGGLVSGENSLDDWLRRRARANQASGAARTFVVCQGDRVIGYYALASGSVAAQTVPGQPGPDTPAPTPVVVLSRLAVDRACQGQGLGRALFRDSVRRVANAADVIGVRGIVVHAISERARAFYLALGFEPSPHDSMTLLVTLPDIRALPG